MVAAVLAATLYCCAPMPTKSVELVYVSFYGRIKWEDGVSYYTVNGRAWNEKGTEKVYVTYKTKANCPVYIDNRVPRKGVLFPAERVILILYLDDTIKECWFYTR